MSLIEKVTQFIKDEFNQPDIGWANRQYEFYLIFGQNDPSRLPWVKSSWGSILNPILISLSDRRSPQGYGCKGINISA